MKRIWATAGAVLVTVSMVAGCGPARDISGASEEARRLSSTSETDLAVAALYRGDNPGAASAAAAALRSDPKNPHALLVAGMANQALGNLDWARQYYEVIITNNLQGTMAVPSDSGGMQNRAIMDIARTNLVTMERSTGRKTAGTSFESGRTPGQPVIGGPALPLPLTAEELTKSRSPMRTSALSESDANIATRFQTLQQLRDEGLITSDEYSSRYSANIGGLLPFSRKPPAAGLNRSTPGTEAVVGRLRDISRALELGEMPPEQYNAERAIILEALMPSRPVQRANPPQSPADFLSAGELVGRTEYLQKIGLISPEEARMERAAIEAAYRKTQRASAMPSDLLQTRDTRRVRTPASPSVGSSAAAVGGGTAATTENSTSPWGVVLGNGKTEGEALGIWERIRPKFPVELGSLTAKPKRLDRRDGQVVWQIIAGPFTNKSEADTLCKTLKLHRQNCDTARMP